MIKIIGDCNFSDGFFDLGIGVGSKICGGEKPFEYLNISENDYWIGNFECVVSHTSNKSGMQRNQFRIAPDKLQHFKHLNLYGVANNHVMQHGADAYNEMLSVIENVGSNYVGTKNRRTHVFEHHRKKISVTAFSLRPENFSGAPIYWEQPEYAEVIDELKKHENLDYRILFLHWGYEFINYPNIDQKHLAHLFIDNGADLIIGMHPHVAQGYEVYNGKYIFYSLGNAVFNMPWEPTKYGLMISVDLSGLQPKISVSHLYIGHDMFPRIVEHVSDSYKLEYLNTLINIKQENEIYFSRARKYYLQYRKKNRKAILANCLKMNQTSIWSIIKDYVKRRVLH